jgi:hypothetical protein
MLRRPSLIVLACLAATAAFAADSPRKIDFAAVLTDADNQPIQECADPDGVPPESPACKTKRSLTLGLVARRALFAPEQGISLDESRRRGDLGLAIAFHVPMPYEITPADADLIEKRIAAIYGPLIVARAHPLLNPTEAK